MHDDWLSDHNGGYRVQPDLAAITEGDSATDPPASEAYGLASVSAPAHHGNPRSQPETQDHEKW
jgi:hypothetical protein